MTMSDISHDNDVVATVESSSSFVMSVGSKGDGGDVASISSNSTKTRFSFYNAEEVQMQEEQRRRKQQQQASSGSGPPPKSPSSQQSSVLAVPGADEKQKNQATTASSAAGNSATNSKERFNFYVASSDSNDAKSTESSLPPVTSDDRSDSPGTALAAADHRRRAAEADNNKRIPASEERPAPASSSSTSTAQTTAKSSRRESPSKAVPSTPSNADTPQRNNVASSVNKKKKRAAAAAAARSRRQTESRQPPTPTAAALASSQPNGGEKGKRSNSKMDSVEILRSLKDTEQMRKNLMKECTAASNNNTDRTRTNEPHTRFQQDTAFQHHSKEQLSVYSGSSRDEYGPRHAPMSDGGSASLQSCSNPYEDAIREALDLLRKHRPPTDISAQMEGMVDEYSRQNELNDLQDHAHLLYSPHRPLSPVAFEMDVVHHHHHNSSGRPSRPLRTPREADRVLQSRLDYELDCESDTAATTTFPVDIEDRRRERKERMARYTERLAEIKSGETSQSDTSRSRTDAPGFSHLVEQSDSDERQLDILLADDSEFEQELHSTSRMFSQMAPPHMLPTIHAVPAPPTDVSVDTASSLSASFKQTDEVHRSVERVLLAILERAHSNGRATQTTNSHHSSSHHSVHSQYSTSVASAPEIAEQHADHLTAWQTTTDSEEKKSAPEDNEDSSGNPRSSSSHSATGSAPTDDPLLRAVGELLASTTAGMRVGASPRHDRGAGAEVSSLTSGGAKRSVVEELLAEVESFAGQDLTSPANDTTAAAMNEDVSPWFQHEPPTLFLSRSIEIDRNSSRSSHHSSNCDGARHDILDSSTGIEAIPPPDMATPSTMVDRQLDALVLKTLGKENGLEVSVDDSHDIDDGILDDKVPADEDGILRESDSEDGDHDDDDDDDDDEDESQNEEDSHDDDDSRSRSRSDEDDSYEDEEEDDGSASREGTDEEDALDGVLGPLSKTGGTTGVVLEPPTSPDPSAISAGERSLFDSLSNAMSSLVASAISGEEKISAPVAAALGKPAPRDKYSIGYEETDEEEETEEEDEEAHDLMRTLCAHLLPFGVDQSSRYLEQVPHWDESNPNEAGYRIIRLTNPQLQRVEIAFESMVNGLKKKSEENLLGPNKDVSGSDKNQNGFDATFERDLAVAEKLLDRQENSVFAPTNVSIVKPDPLPSDDDFESSTSHDNDTPPESPRTNVCHPDFPGVHSAGKGEMGDLEYFSLPVIFKSQVTGFEPTKDLMLEPGNVVAGQYLVESELGSAAFSTAYRCVDLNSEGDDTEDGRQEVCLKVIKNTKDFFDQSLDEIKILELLRQTGRCHENNIIQMKTFFYHREHLIIVTELLRQNLFEFGKFILDHDEEPYFTLPRLGYITRQVLIALRFVHKLGLVHSDVKPENILLGSYSRAKVKLIDFGSSCYLTDRQSSYIQSRSYRAPEVVLGLPYDGKIDVWSLGCVVAEMFTGEVTFQNDSIVSMLSRIEAICGPFPRHMIAQGRQSCRFFTKCGLLFEQVTADGDGEKTPDDTDEEDDSQRKKPQGVFDLFQPKITSFSARLGFAPDLLDRFLSGATLDPQTELKAMFVDFARKLLTVDPDTRPSAAEALKHPWMVYAESLTEDDIKYPST